MTGSAHGERRVGSGSSIRDCPIGLVTSVIWRAQRNLQHSREDKGQPAGAQIRPASTRARPEADSLSTLRLALPYRRTAAPEPWQNGRDLPAASDFPQITEENPMKSRHHLSVRNTSGTGRTRTLRPARQISACVLPTVVATVVTWYTFASLGDWQLCLVLGGMAFITVVPLTARLSDRGSAQRRDDR